MQRQIPLSPSSLLNKFNNGLFHLTHVVVKYSLYRGSGARGLSAGSIGREKTMKEGIG